MSILLRTDTQKKVAGLLFGSGFILYTGFNAKGLEKIENHTGFGCYFRLSLLRLKCLQVKGL